MGDDSLTDEDVEEACRLANALKFIKQLSEQKSRQPQHLKS
ncbi:hypothetical protein ANCDUO_21127 [Ancylostoma duodenale]|uniref:Uncharacterized protein n=1 Tax=Ancylostoma duodenale TaxID=51022 RepID=A0A0C2FJM9_9BILA|nr:hypothetical protein ANCDUO_21127 [Ancylostoma duodenale]